MKKLLLFITMALLTAGSVFAQVIMDADNLNGDFEDGWGPAPRAFDTGPSGVGSWYNVGSGDQTATCAHTNLAAAPASGYNGVLSDNNTSGAVLHSVNTGVTIADGDYFEISFDWRDAAGWEANDQIRVAVVAYDTDTAAGTEVYRAWVNDKVTTATTWESVSGQTAIVDPAAVGRTLFIQAYGVNGGAGSGDFARIDNIVVTRKSYWLIMDGDNYNGDFEDGWGTAPRAFDTGPSGVGSWFNVGTGDQSATCAHTNLAAAPASGYNGVLADKNTSGVVLHSAKTASTIDPGNYFEISFDWRDASGWEAGDKVRVAIVAYDTDTAAGTEVYRDWVQGVDADLGGDWLSVTGQTARASAAAWGRTLFVQVYGVNGGANSAGFARVDNIVVTRKDGLTIMDGDNLNGDFEDGWGTGARAFDAATGVANWWNAGTGNQTATCANSNLVAAPASGYNGVLADKNISGAVLHSAATEYYLQAGDSFDITFDWRDASGWEANDKVRVAVVAYDTDTVGGTEIYRDWVQGIDTGLGADWVSVTGQTAVVTSSAVGHKLFIQTYGVNGGANSAGFARVDNITVTWIPDTVAPSAPTLGLAAGDNSIYVGLSGEPDETFNIYRATTSGGYGSPIATNVASGYLDTGVVNGSLYYYVANAVDSLGRESGLSNEDSAIPMAYLLHSVKKGVGNSSNDKLLQKKRVEGLHADWYYSWSMDRNFNMNSGIEYVPMRQSKFWPPLTDLANVGSYSNVLAWNEPYQVTVPAWEQVTVANAVNDGMYQDIVDAALLYGEPGTRIGSPSFVDPANTNAYWQDAFMPLAVVSNLQVDFVTCHAYPNPADLAAQVKNTVDGLYAEYGLPVWVTEFNGGDWPDDANSYTMAQTYTEMIELLYYFETTAYVERYAIFPWDDTYAAASASQVFEIEVVEGVTNKTAVLTPLGKLYAEYRSIDVGGPYADTWYYLHNKGSEQRLNHAGTPAMTGISAEGTDVCFKIVDAGAPNVYIVNRNSGDRLSSNGTTVEWVDSTVYGATVEWRVVNGPDGWDHVFHPLSNKRLSGNPLSMVAWTISDDTTQWSFVRAYPLATDIDNDDMADTWELDQFGSLATSEGGSDNYDGDAYTDADEYIAGTSATDTNSYFQMALNNAGAGMLDVIFEGVADRTYRLETTEDLIGGPWTVGTIIGPVPTNGTQILEYTDAGDPEALFGRVSIFLP